MKRYPYGHRMLITDLILTSIWALFFSRYCSMALLLLFAIRIALCFEMERKSPWVLVSAIGFLIAFISAECFTKPFERMFYLFFCAIGKSELMVDIFSQPLEWEMNAWISIFSALWFIWLVILPIIVGFRQRNITKIHWKRKGIWIYFIPLTSLCVWVMFDEGSVGGIMEGLVVSFIPAIYWSVYVRNGRSAIQLILEDRKILWYFAYFAFFVAVLTTGLKDIYLLRFLGVLLLPPVFFIMLSRSFGLGTVLTRGCAVLSVSGWLYWLALDTEQWLTFVLLGTVILLIVYVGVSVAVRSKKWTMPLILMLGLPIVVIPGILGLNPYVVTETEHTRIYVTNLSVRNGVYVVEKYFERGKKGEPHYWGMKYGLRDRYGIILPIKYSELRPVDRYGRYIATNSPVNYGSMVADQRYGVYDLRKRTFVVDPDNIEVAELEKIDDRSFKLINPDGRHFATLYLPGEYRSVYFSDAHIEPHFADGDVSVAEFMEMSENVDLDIEDKYWKAMRKEHPHAYNLLRQITALGCTESSPFNDLNYAKAISQIIQKDSHYKSDIAMALNDVEKLSVKMTDSGSQSDINTWSDCLRLLSSIRTSLAYDSLMNTFSDNEGIKREYVAWHNLMEVMAYYQDNLYSTETYLSIPEEKNTSIKHWLDYRRESLDKESEIISDNLIYSVPPAKAESIRGESDFNELFSHFHPFNQPHYYHPMWNEVKTAFDEWRSARNIVADKLDPHRSLSYREHSREVVDSIFSFIKELDRPESRPVLYR